MRKMTGTPQFIRCCAAIAGIVMIPVFMNSALFPRFDTLFTYARDLSVLFQALALLALGVLAFQKPSYLKPRILLVIVICFLLIGAIGLTSTLLTVPSTGLLVVGACIFAAGRGLVSIFVGIACSQLGVQKGSVCVVVGWLIGYACAQVFLQVSPSVSIALYILLPFVTLGLVWTFVWPAIDAIHALPAPMDWSITRPRSFLNLTSRFFICLFMFKVAFGYSLRFGETEGTPISALWNLIPLFMVTVWMFMRVKRNKTFPWDLVMQLCFLSVVAGYLLTSIGTHDYAEIAVMLLSAGTTVFDIVIWVVLVAVAAKNEYGSISLFGWGLAWSGIGTTVGATLGTWSNTLAGDDTTTLAFSTATLLFVFVAFITVGLKRFSFTETVEMVTSPVAEVPEERALQLSDESMFETRCKRIAEESGLTARELEVFKMLARGRNREYIETALVVSRNTVKAHVKHIYTKLSIHSHQELIDLIAEE